MGFFIYNLGLDLRVHPKLLLGIPKMYFLGLFQEFYFGKSLGYNSWLFIGIRCAVWKLPKRVPDTRETSRSITCLQEFLLELIQMHLFKFLLGTLRELH